MALALVAGAGAGSAQTSQPEAASGFDARPAVTSAGFLAVTANPLATHAAVETLLRGGNALDAAIAAQWTLNLVEPQSSGIGGGGFLLYWDSIRGRLSAWDGRETAPRAARPDFAARPDGTVASFDEIVATGKAVGVPGIVAMLAEAHRRHGRLPWSELVMPAVRLAEGGFHVSMRLHRLLRDDPYLRRDPDARRLYYDANGAPLPPGGRLVNLELASTLRAIAADGRDALCRGDIGERIVRAVATRGGSMDLADLCRYRARSRDAVCGRYRQWTVCGMPPPSSGGIGVLQLLGLIERSGPPENPESVGGAHRFAEAGRLVYADRARYLADGDFVPVPWQNLISPAYLDRRARLIDPVRTMGIAQPGEIDLPERFGDDSAAEFPATTHLSIVDREGNAVVLTSSIESAFGSRIQVGGFLLNNQLTDFSFLAERDGRPIANRLEPGKRPLSSMAPTLVFADDGRLHGLLGSPGGSRIINYVARTLISILDGWRDPSAALAMPHLGNRNGATELEHGASEFLAGQLSNLGHTIWHGDMTSGLHLIIRDGERWIGAVDPRREGLAVGE